MERELKFRVWNGMQMVYDVTVGKFGTFYVNPMSKGDGLDEKDSASLTPFNTRYSDTTPVMQYTGLKDKEGKEIYEGDIVMAISEQGFDHGTHKSKYFEVFWFENNGAWYITRKYKESENMGTYTSICEMVANCNIKITGNIYENPELLTK